MSLESGLYFITSFAGDAPVGRNSNEDMSLQPKRVSIQDKSSDVNPVRLSFWVSVHRGY